MISLHGIRHITVNTSKQLGSIRAVAQAFRSSPSSYEPETWSKFPLQPASNFVSQAAVTGSWSSSGPLGRGGLVVPPVKSKNPPFLCSSKTSFCGPGLTLRTCGRTMSTASSLFAEMVEAPPDPILNTAAMFKNDTDPRKVNLGIGAYRTEEAKPWVLPVVVKAEEEMLADINGKIDKEYLPIDGLQSLKDATQRLILGKAMSNIASAQTLSGTGSLRVCAEFLQVHLGVQKVYYSDPTWGNHPAIFEAAGIKAEKYPYWDAAKKGIKIEEWLKHLAHAPDRSCYLIHPCAHNPTGMDPTSEQWDRIIQKIVEKKHLVILDSAYQGYASGSLETDRETISKFMATGMEMFVCQSFAKNLGLYGERIGMLHIVCKTEERAKVVLSQIKMVIRPMYSSPPLHGAHLVSKILNSESLYKQWTDELKFMADRIGEMRKGLREGLEAKGTPGNWDHVTKQIGMFSFTGLTPDQCERLIKEHHIYLLKSGRISLAGLTRKNLQYVIDAFDEVVRNSPKM